VLLSLKRILKFAIILLGLQLSLQQVVEVGPAGLSIVAVTLLHVCLHLLVWQTIRDQRSYLN
jgi:uncharacterized membrane protein YadS